MEIIIMLYLEDVKDEAQALDAVGDLEIQAIEASEAITNKRNRIIRAERDIKMLAKLCLLRKYTTPMKALQDMLDKLGEAKVEMQVNLWRS